MVQEQLHLHLHCFFCIGRAPSFPPWRNRLATDIDSLFAFPFCFLPKTDPNKVITGDLHPLSCFFSCFSARFPFLSQVLSLLFPYVLFLGPPGSWVRACANGLQG